MKGFGLTTAGSAEGMPERFSGPREAGRAFVGVAKGWLVFLQIAAPWTLVLAVSLALLEMIGPSSHGTTFQALAVLLGDPLLVIAALLSIPTVAVAWHRWIIQGRRPRLGLAITDLAALAYAKWFWWLITFGCLSSLVSGALAGFIAKGLIDILFGFIAFVMVAVTVAAFVAMLLSTVALRFPAMAVGDAGFPPQNLDSDDDIKRERALDLAHGIPWGVGLTFVPLAIAGTAVLILTPIPPRGVFDLINLSVLTAGLLLIFVATAAAAGCLSSAYLAAKPVMIHASGYRRAEDDADEDDD